MVFTYKINHVKVTQGGQSHLHLRHACPTFQFFSKSLSCKDLSKLRVGVSFILPEGFFKMKIILVYFGSTIEQTGHIHNPSLRSFFKMIKQKVRKEKVTDVIDLKRSFTTILSYRVRKEKHSSIVDEDVQVLFLLGKLCSKISNGLERVQIEMSIVNLRIPCLLNDILSSFFTTFLISASQINLGISPSQVQSCFLSNSFKELMATDE